MAYFFRGLEEIDELGVIDAMHDDEAREEEEREDVAAKEAPNLARARRDWEKEELTLREGCVEAVGFVSL